MTGKPVSFGGSITRSEATGRVSIAIAKESCLKIYHDFENSKAAFQRREQLFLEGGISKEKYEEFRKVYLISQAKLRQVQVEEIELFFLRKQFFNKKELKRNKS